MTRDIATVLVGLILLLIASAGATAGTWYGLNLWERHNQQHQTYELQIKELQGVVNLLLQERAQRGK